MNEEIANHITQLRTGPIEHSWRVIAALVAEAYPTYTRSIWPEPSIPWGNQLFGEEVCVAAAAYLGVTSEQYNSTWN